METQLHIPSRCQRIWRLNVFWWLLCLIVFSLLYLVTCQRGVSWQDSGMLQYRILTGDYHGRLGLALAHPLYIAAGRVVLWLSGKNFAFALNFFAGLGTAVALANLAAIVTLLTGKRWIGLTIATMLAVTHATWWLSTITEAGYTWNIAALTAELWLLVLLIRKPGWRLMAAIAFISGLDLCIHNFALLPLPVYVAVAIYLIVKKKLSSWSLVAAGSAYILGAGLYIGMMIDLAVRSGDLIGAIHSALFGNYAKEVLSIAPESQFFKANVALMAMNFVSLLLPLAVVGWFAIRRRIGGVLAAALGAITVIEIIFVVRYPVPDQFMFILPSLVMIAISAGVGVSVLADTSRRWRIAAITACAISIILPPISYASAPSLIRAAGMEPKRSRELPFRDEMRYWLIPWKHNERSAELFAAAALKQASPNGVILSDNTPNKPLVLVQYRDKIGANVTIQCDGNPLPPYSQNPKEFRRILGHRTLYIVSPVAGHLSKQLLDDAKFIRNDGEVLYKAHWKKTGNPLSSD